MTKSLSDRITESRRLLQNPYAYLNDFGGYSAFSDHDQPATQSEITKSRLLLGDPYAHLDESGDFEALSNSSHTRDDVFSDAPQGTTPKYIPLEINTPKKDRYSNIEIEQHAISLQRRMWHDRSQIWADATPSNPIDILDPTIALKLMGYNVDVYETLGQFYIDGKLIEVAGTIDKSSKQVHISRRFPFNIRSFTAAHELGHALLHESSGLHRDKPLDGAIISRNSVEIEADKFATFFLMPQKLVQAAFRRIFLTERFFLNEETAFALGLGDYDSLNNKTKILRQLAKLIASAEQYNGVHFTSLANYFRVSTDAMAIRLDELELLSI